MPINQGRQFHEQEIHYFRKRVNWNDAGIAAGVQFGTLPAGSMIVQAYARVNTAFNAGTTNVVTVGTTATGGEVLASATIAAGTTGFKTATTGTAFAATFAADQDLFVSFTQTGAAATAGQADIVVAYIPNNDQ